MKATSLALATNEEHDIKSSKMICFKILIAFIMILNLGNEYLNICRDNSSLLGKEVIIDDFRSRKPALVLDILKSGNILLEVEGRKREYSSGEISLKEFYNAEVR